MRRLPPRTISAWAAMCLACVGHYPTTSPGEGTLYCFLWVSFFNFPPSSNLE